MLIYKLMGFLGWLTVAGVGLALSNFLVKWLNKHWISKMDASQAAIKNAYKSLMKLILRYHKALGLLAAVAMAIHMGINISNGNINIKGLIAAGLLIWVAAWGAFGAFVVKKKATWFVIHRYSVILLAVAIAIHVL